MKKTAVVAPLIVVAGLAVIILVLWAMNRPGPLEAADAACEEEAPGAIYWGSREYLEISSIATENPQAREGYGESQADAFLCISRELDMPQRVRSDIAQTSAIQGQRSAGGTAYLPIGASTLTGVWRSSSRKGDVTLDLFPLGPDTQKTCKFETPRSHGCAVEIYACMRLVPVTTSSGFARSPCVLHQACTVSSNPSPRKFSGPSASVAHWARCSSIRISITWKS